jgi:hypothetical protein
MLTFTTKNPWPSPILPAPVFAKPRYLVKNAAGTLSLLLVLIPMLYPNARKKAARARNHTAQPETAPKTQEFGIAQEIAAFRNPGVAMYRLRKITMR